MNFRQFLAILESHRRIAIAVFVTVVLAANVVALLIPRQYLASSSVVVDVKGDPLANTTIPDEAMAAYLGTQVDIASSAPVAQRVIAALKLDELPALRRKWHRSLDSGADYPAWVTRTLRKKVTVKPSNQSNVLEIEVLWPDPPLAVSIADAWAQAYIDTNIALKVSLAKQYAILFEERSQALRADLEAKQKNLSDFEVANGIVATDDRLDVETTRLAELSSQLIAIQAQRQESQSRERQGGNDVQGIPEVLQNSLVVSLKTDLSKAEAKLKDIETTLGPSHPGYLSAEAEVASLRRRLAHESAAIVNGLGDSTRVNQQREDAVNAALAEQRNRLLALKHQHDQVAVMRSEVATAQRNLDAVTQRLAQSSLEGATKQTNIALLDPATLPTHPAGPRHLLVLALSMLAGALCGLLAVLAVELADQRIHTDEELEALLGVPVYGSVGKIVYPPLPEASFAPVIAQLEPNSP